MADSPVVLESIHPLSDGRSGTSPDLRRIRRIQTRASNNQWEVLDDQHSLDSAGGRAVKGTNRKSVTFGGLGFEPEAPQLFLPKWSKIPKTSPPEAVSEVPTRLDRPALDDALEHFGIDPNDGREVPDVDLFATAKNRLFPKHVEGSDDPNGAFKVNWGCYRLSLIHTSSKYMPKVVDKVICDGGRSIVVYVAG